MGAMTIRVGVERNDSLSCYDICLQATWRSTSSRKSGPSAGRSVKRSDIGALCVYGCGITCCAGAAQDKSLSPIRGSLVLNGAVQCVVTVVC